MLFKQTLEELPPLPPAAPPPTPVGPSDMDGSRALASGPFSPDSAWIKRARFSGLLRCSHGTRSSLLCAPGRLQLAELL